MINRRIRRPKDQEYIYKELTDTSEFGVFETYKDLFMMAMVVGFLEGERLAFEQTLEEISWQVFKESTDEPVINMIAFLESEDIDLLYGISEEVFDKKMKIAEEYAAGGASKIYNVVMEDQKNGSQKLVDFLQSFEGAAALTESKLKNELNW